MDWPCPHLPTGCPAGGRRCEGGSGGEGDAGKRTARVAPQRGTFDGFGAMTGQNYWGDPPPPAPPAFHTVHPHYFTRKQCNMVHITAWRGGADRGVAGRTCPHTGWGGITRGGRRERGGWAVTPLLSLPIAFYMKNNTMHACASPGPPPQHAPHNYHQQQMKHSWRNPSSGTPCRQPTSRPANSISYMYICHCARVKRRGWRASCGWHGGLSGWGE